MRLPLPYLAGTAMGLAAFASTLSFALVYSAGAEFAIGEFLGLVGPLIAVTVPLSTILGALLHRSFVRPTRGAFAGLLIALAVLAATMLYFVLTEPTLASEGWGAVLGGWLLYASMVLLSPIGWSVLILGALAGWATASLQARARRKA